MAGIIERNARFQAIIKQRTEIKDGKAVWSEVECRCFSLDFEQADKDYFGSIQNGKIIMVAPMESAPKLPGFIVYEGVEYEMRGVRIYRNLKGVTMGYRIAVAGAS